MSNKNLEKMKDNLEKRMNGFIMGGLSGGFQFDEEQAQYLQELQDMMIYIYEGLESEIDALNQAISFAKHHSDTQEQTIVDLQLENEKIRWSGTSWDQGSNSEIKVFKCDKQARKE